MRTLNNIDPLIANKKWAPIIDHTFTCKSEQIKNLICLFCEWYSSDSYQNINDLPKKIKDIVDKVNSYDRIEIVGKFYNPASGLVEYKLLNGEYIPVDSISNYKISNSELLKIFDINFIRDLDPSVFREEQLNKVL